MQQERRFDEHGQRSAEAQGCITSETSCKNVRASEPPLGKAHVLNLVGLFWLRFEVLLWTSRLHEVSLISYEKYQVISRFNTVFLIGKDV